MGAHSDGCAACAQPLWGLLPFEANCAGQGRGWAEGWKENAAELETEMVKGFPFPTENRQGAPR